MFQQTLTAWRRPLLTLFVGGCITSAAAARDLYVNNLSGDNQLSGLNQKISGKDGPVRTIGRALQLAQASDRVIVANTGVAYREQLALSGPRHSGSQRQPFLLQSDGAVIDGTVSAPRGAWQPVSGGVFAMRPRRLAYQQLFRDGAPLRRVRLASWPTTPGHNIETALQPLEWSLAGGAVLLRVEQGRLPDSYALRHAGLQTGVTLYNVRNATVEGFVVQGFQQDGVNAHEGVRDCRLQNLELRANGRSGLTVGGASRVVAANCRLYDNGESQARTEGLARLDLRGGEVDAGAEGFSRDYDNRGRELTIDGVPLRN